MNKYEQFYESEQTDIILANGEQILWEGKPNKKAFILNSILPMMPIALLWLIFDGFFIATIIFTGAFKEIAFFVIPFFAIHLFPVWKWIGDILSSAVKWEKTRYLVTDKRIVIQSGFISSNVNSIYYKDIDHARLHIGVFDKIFNVGDIIISSNKYWERTSNSSSSSFSILDIENPHETYRRIQKIILDIQTDIEYPNDLRPKTNWGYNTIYKS